MNKAQENKLKMYLAVQKYLENNADKTNTLPNYAETFAQYKNLIQEIQNNKTNQEVNKVGLAKNKNNLKATLAQATYLMSNKVKAFATFNNQTVLLHQVSYSKSELQTSADNTLIDKAKIVLEKVIENLVALNDYKVSQEQVNQLQESLNSFTATVSDPRLGTITKKGVTTDLRDAFDTINALLKDKLDALINLLEEEETTFFKGYKNVRMIVDLKSKVKSREEGEILESEK
jgi:hypothetical protein